MPVSVIVSNFNGARFLPKLLETLKGQQGIELELIVVDRNSNDGSHEILAQHPDVRVIKEPPESGLVAGYACGVPFARHDMFFFCNEDMWFEPDCLLRVEAQFREAERVGAVMPVQLSYDGSELVNAGAWFGPARWHRANPHPFRASIVRRVAEPDFIPGINAGACMISRSAYEAIGGWDTSFFLDYEDMDLSLRLWQHDFVCRIEPQAIVYHAVGASNTKDIHGGKTKVFGKRYVSALSNQIVIALKSFTGVAPLAAPAVLADRFVRNVFTRRFEFAKLDMKAFWLTLRRTPEILRYRREHRGLNRTRPGQAYFSDPRFDASAQD